MTHRQTATSVPYHPTQMFDLVADVERYPEFLPWCPALRIVEDKTENGAGELITDMIVAYKVFREKFRSRVALDPQTREINVDFVRGPFRRLYNYWRFEESPGGAIVHFEIDFELRSIFLQSAAAGFFEAKFTRMSDAFIQRADEIYG